MRARVHRSNNEIEYGCRRSRPSVAVAKAVKLFVENNPEAAKKDFTSVTAISVGEERFNVQIILKDKTVFKYECGLDASAQPVKWGCKSKL